jgi:hypothetical protein
MLFSFSVTKEKKWKFWKSQKRLKIKYIKKNLLKDPQLKISLFYPQLKIQKVKLDIFKMSIFGKSMADGRIF